jgi:uncharacterized protein
MAAEALADTRVVVVNGARQVGKSTLAELIVARSPGGRELYLDVQTVRAAAEADPSAFVRHDYLCKERLGLDILISLPKPPPGRR